MRTGKYSFTKKALVLSAWLRDWTDIHPRLSMTTNLIARLVAVALKKTLITQTTRITNLIGWYFAA